MVKSRLARLRARLVKEKLDGLLVTLPANRRYLSGFSPENGQWGESSGSLLITPYDAIVFTDFRYELTARAQVPLFTTRIHRRGLAAELAAVLQGSRVKRLGFEAEGLLVDQRDRLAEALGGGVKLMATRGLVLSLRLCKDQTERSAISRSLGVIERVLGKLLDRDQGGLAGLRERELAVAISQGVVAAGADGDAFAPIVASGSNAAEPHAEPGERRLAPGEPVIFDVGAKAGGYCSDISRTVVVGGLEAASTRFREIYVIVRRAQLKTIAEVRPGMSGAEADAIGRRVIEEAGYGERFGHSLGHGVGLATHEPPSLSPQSKDILAPGMVFTVEPGIYLPGWGGVRLEQMVALTKAGCRLLNGLGHFYEI
jgi:Xaa-Pro aminopeptidase